jgi:hypothetical protein
MGFTPETAKAIEKAFVEAPQSFVADGKFGDDAKLSQKVEPINGTLRACVSGRHVTSLTPSSLQLYRRMSLPEPFIPKMMTSLRRSFLRVHTTIFTK